MELIIPNLRNRYSISDKGVVYSHYRYQNNGKKRYRKEVVAKTMNGANATSPVVALFEKKGKRAKKFFVNTLMADIFGIKPPDRYHFYDLIPKDGDNFNNSRENLIFRIRSLNEWEYYPQPFYNKYGRITHKICGVCGEKKSINNYNLQDNVRYGESNHKTYRNLCEQCRSDRQWAAIKADIERSMRKKLQTERWAKSKAGKKYYSQYHKDSHAYDYKHITPHYIATSLRLSEKDLTPQIVQLARKRISLYRKVFKNK